MIKAIEDVNVDDVLKFIDAKIKCYRCQPMKLEDTKFFMNELKEIREKVEALK